MFGEDVVIFGDLASTAGFAIGNSREMKPFALTYQMPKPAYEGEYGRRLTHYRNFLSQLIQDHRPKVFAFEAPIDKAREATGRNRAIVQTQATNRILFGMAVIAEQLAEELGVPMVVEKKVREIRAFFCSNGNASKDDVKKVCRTLGWGFKNDNESDALAGWCVVSGERNPRLTALSTSLFAGAR